MATDITALKTLLETEIKRTELELKAKKMLLKKVKKKAKTPFIETHVGRGINHVIAFMTYPFAVAHHNARMRLDKPKEYRAEKVLKRAEATLEKARETSKSARRAQRMAVRCALMEAALTEYTVLPEYSNQVKQLQKLLAEEAKRLGALPIREVKDGEDVDGVEDMLRNLGFGAAIQGA